MHHRPVKMAFTETVTVANSHCGNLGSELKEGSSCRCHGMVLRASHFPHGWTLDITGVQEPSLLTFVVVSLGFKLTITR